MFVKYFLGIVTFLLASQFVSAQWIKQTVNTTASFRGLSVVNEKVIWASGTEGTVIKTIDGGKTWKVMPVPGAEKLDFRDIEAFDANTAYILSIGNGESSRIYTTTDGGETWALKFKNEEKEAFFDAMACWDRKLCYAVSDPVQGTFAFVGTENGWKTLGDDYVFTPKTKDGEAAFAASGSCLIIDSVQNIFLVSGGTVARVFAFRWPDRADSNLDGSWRISETPVVHGNSGSGIFSIAMFDLSNGVIVGGNYEKPNEAKDNLAFSTDGGKSWKLSTGLNGYRSGVTYVDKNTIVAVGTNGSDITRDGGKTWKVFGKEDLNAIQSKGKQATWAVGPKGMVVKGVLVKMK